MSNLRIEGLNGVGEFGGMSQATQGSRMERLGQLEGGSSAGGFDTSQVGGAGDAKNTFSGLLEKSIEDANIAQTQADEAVKEVIAGRSKNLHEAMLAIEKADLSLKYMVQVRNKVLDAYREVMRMQV